jgi:acetoin utilization deacetylase AcuC-like enzyme
LRVSADGYRAAGRVLGRLGLPTVVVQEGGYDLAAIGRLVGEALAGIEEGRA